MTFKAAFLFLDRKDEKLNEINWLTTQSSSNQSLPQIPC